MPQAPTSSDEATRFLVWSDGQVVDVGSGTAAREQFRQAETPFAIVVAPGITWKVDYADLKAVTPLGFADPQVGAARRKAFEDALAYHAAMLNISRPVTIDVTVGLSLNTQESLLAHAGTFYPSTTPGIYPGHAARHIQTGIDPDLTMADIAVQFNFGHPYHTGTSAPPAGLYDLRTVAIHEITHALGMTTLLTSNGTSNISGTNPGALTKFDRLTASANTTPLVDDAGRFLGTAEDLGGAAGDLTWLGTKATVVSGHAPRLFTPNPFQPGSSASHWSAKEGEAVMLPSLAAGVRRREHTQMEIGMLRDLGYSNARLPTARVIDFEPPRLFPAKNWVTSALVGEFDDKNGADLLMLEIGPSPALRIYSNFDVTKSYLYPLPEGFTQMSLSRVGPRANTGVVLATLRQETLLSLGGLTLPNNGNTLNDSHFQHVHQVRGPQSQGGISYDVEGRVAIADLDGTGGPDVLTVSAAYGLLPFLNDGKGYFDRLINPRTWVKLGGPGPALDLTAYETGNGLGVDVPGGLWDTNDIQYVEEPPGTLKTRARIGTGNTYRDYRIDLLARYGPLGFAELEQKESGKRMLARLRLDGGNYHIEQIWPDRPRARNIKVVTPSAEPLFAIFSTDNHTIERWGTTDSPPSRLAGSVKGYLNGPLAEAQFDTPTSLCVHNRQIYVVDKGNAVIRKIDLATGQVSKLAGTPGLPGWSDGPADVARFGFAYPNGADTCAIVGDSLYLFDTPAATGPFLVRKINLRSGYVTTLPSDALGPLDRPGYLDAFENHIFFLKNDGKSTTIQTAETFVRVPSATPATQLRVGDFNGDGKPDAIVVLGGAYNALHLYKGQGNGHFLSLRTITLNEYPRNVELIDINADGHLDLVVSTSSGVRVFLGDGNGGFKDDVSRTMQIYGDIIWSTVRDLNKDGKPELFVMTARGRLMVWYADSEGRWGSGPGDDREDIAANLETGNIPQWFDVIINSATGRFDVLTRSTEFGVRWHKGRVPQPLGSNTLD